MPFHKHRTGDVGERLTASVRRTPLPKVLLAKRTVNVRRKSPYRTRAFGEHATGAKPGRVASRAPYHQRSTGIYFRIFFRFGAEHRFKERTRGWARRQRPGGAGFGRPRSNAPLGVPLGVTIAGHRGQESIPRAEVFPGRRTRTTVTLTRVEEFHLRTHTYRHDRGQYVRVVRKGASARARLAPSPGIFALRFEI